MKPARLKTILCFLGLALLVTMTVYLTTKKIYSGSSTSQETASKTESTSKTVRKYTRRSSTENTTTETKNNIAVNTSHPVVPSHDVHMNLDQALTAFSKAMEESQPNLSEEKKRNISEAIKRIQQGAPK